MRGKVSRFSFWFIVPRRAEGETGSVSGCGSLQKMQHLGELVLMFVLVVCGEAEGWFRSPVS